MRVSCTLCYCISSDEGWWYGGWQPLMYITMLTKNLAKSYVLHNFNALYSITGEGAYLKLYSQSNHQLVSSERIFSGSNIHNIVKGEWNTLYSDHSTSLFSCCILYCTAWHNTDLEVNYMYILLLLSSWKDLTPWVIIWIWTYFRS